MINKLIRLYKYKTTTYIFIYYNFYYAWMRFTEKLSKSQK